MRRFILAAALTSGGTIFAQVNPAAYVNFEGAQTSPVRLSPDGTRLFAVNTADARLSVFDVTSPLNPVLIQEVPVGIEPVSVNARTNDEVWVVNQESDSVSIVSVSKGIVVDTIQARDEPADVVFAGRYAFVSASRSNEILVFNAFTRAPVKRIPVFGGNPRALAVSITGNAVYAAFALSGNKTTLLPLLVAPVPPKPTNPALPVPPQVGLIIDARNPLYAWAVDFQMPDNDVVAIDTGTLNVAGYSSGVGTINLALAVRPGSGELFVANTEARNVIRFEPNLRGHWIDSRITRIRTTGAVIPYDLNPDIDYSALPNPAARAAAISQPASIVFDPSGNFMYVASFGTDRIARVDTSGRVQARINLSPPASGPAMMRGPRGLALLAAESALYSLNRVSNTISVIDLRSNSIVREIPTGSFDPTPQVIRIGRGFLYDARLSGNGTGSCASCHIDADMDHLAWDLGDPGGDMSSVTQNGIRFDFHPMKGPMVTQALRGLKDTAPYHWRGDRMTLADFNPTFDKLMGGSQLSTADMTAFANFLNTIVYMPNPYQELDGSLPASLQGGNAMNGKRTFETMKVRLNFFTCNSCHTANPGPGTNNRIQNFPGQDQPMKIAQLRNVYQKMLFTNRTGAQSIDGFGIEHDGGFPGIFQLLSVPSVFGAIATNTQAKLDVAAYVLSLDTGMAPAAGFTRTLTSANVDRIAPILEWTLLQSEAAAGDIELIAKGTINGERRGLLYQPSRGTYLSDKTGVGPFTATQLAALIRAGDTLTVMGVPPGTGQRMGIDRDLNGIFDGDQ